MSNTKFSNFKSEDGNTGPDLVGITTFTSPYYFVPPSGTTAQRPSGEGLTPGMLRFNTDIGRLEVWRGDHWATILGESPNLDGGARGVFGGGGPAPSTTTVDYITISTLGNAVAWGAAITQSRTTLGGFASRTRGCWACGSIGVGPYYNNTIDYVTISSTGSVTDFGDDVARTLGDSAVSTETRGVIGGGGFPSGKTNTITYVTIASTGNSVTFGNLSEARDDPGGAFSSSTRGVFCAGYASPAYINTVDYVTISTTGNAVDFGDLLDTISRSAGLSNSTRGVIAGGRNATTESINTINFVTIATTGNAQDFGDLITSQSFVCGASSSTRGVFGGGYAPAGSNVIQYITISTTGNAIDFGDLTVGRGALGCFSNGHGGL